MEKEDLIERLTEFLSEFYKNELITAVAEGRKFVIVDFSLIDKFDIELADHLLEYPEETFSAIEDAIKQIDTGLAETKVRLRFTNIPESREIRIRNIRSEHIGKIIVIEGFVRRASEIRPEVSEAIFQCGNCGTRTAIIQNERIIKNPTECEGCDNTRNFKLIGQSLYDARWVTVEEPSEVTSGERPSNIMVYLKEDLTSPKMHNKTDPGNRLKIVGVLKELPKRFKGTRSRQMDIYVEANYIESIESEWEELEISNEDEQKILEIARDPMIYKKLVQSVAPALYGLDEVKEAISLQIFGGEMKTLKDKSKVRGDIHILLIGDPSTAKSSMMKVVSNLIPRGKYVSGKGVTAAGLTATVTKDEDFLGGWILEAGALVMCNRSMICIDEFEKVEKSDQVSLHEAMEQQSYHPDTEITLADGSKRKIGDLVDSLMDQDKENVVEGVNCEILPVKNLEILTTDFKKVYKTKVSRISRHSAPDSLVKITYANGRTILVTPEHPVWTLNGLSVGTIPARFLKVGQFVPYPKRLEIVGKRQKLVDSEVRHLMEKQIQAPRVLDEDLGRMMGYHTSEGYRFSRKDYREISMSNTDPYILRDTESLMYEKFGLPYSQPHLSNLTINRCPSYKLHRFFKLNFPELMSKAREKHVPEFVMMSPQSVVKGFLSAAYIDDGFIDNKRFGFVTVYPRLAKEYQELLLRVGIYSYLTQEKRDGAYKVVVSGTQSMKIFLDEVLDKRDKRKDRIERLIEMSEATKKDRIDFPSSLTVEIKSMLSSLKIDDGYLCRSERKRCGITEDVLVKYIEKVREMAERILTSVKHENDIVGLRKACKISQSDLEKRFGIKRQTVSYIERHTGHKRIGEILSCVKTLAEERVRYALSLCDKMQGLIDSEIGWMPVKKVEIVRNDSCKWVYDLTVEPTRSFISECLVLHNSISIAKANIVATLPARTTILAGGNPKLGRFDPYLPIKEQIEIPETLLSRFDLKFALRDLPNSERDAKIADHIMRTRFFAESEAEPVIKPELIRKYVAYARKNCHPQMSQEAADELRNFYLTLRGRSGEDSPIAITPRQYEGLIRLAEASAKIQLRPFVTKEDALRAINLMKASLRQFGFEPETGKIDIDRAEGQKSTAAQRSRIRVMIDVIDDLSKSHGKDVPVDDILKQARQEGLDAPEDILRKMLNEGLLFQPRQGYINKL